MTKQEIRQELIDEMVSECFEQIKEIEHKRDHEYLQDLEQHDAFNKKIRYYKFMISRLEGYEKRVEDFIKSFKK